MLHLRMPPDTIKSIATWGVALGAAYAFIRQCRKPTGWLGRRLARAMNIGHGGLTAWGLEPLRIDTDSRVLDIGCGGGQTIRRHAERATAGHVDGVDYSAASVSVAQERNADLIVAGRVTVQQGSVSQLPFGDASFDAVTGIETHYYWPDLQSDFREVLRVLKPAGQFVLVAEAFKGRRMNWMHRIIMQGVLRSNYLTLDEHRRALLDAGFVDVIVETNESRSWMRAAAIRPPVPTTG